MVKEKTLEKKIYDLELKVIELQRKLDYSSAKLLMQESQAMIYVTCDQCKETLGHMILNWTATITITRCIKCLNTDD